MDLISSPLFNERVNASAELDNFLRFLIIIKWDTSAYKTISNTDADARVAKFNNVEHRFTNITADSLEHTVYGSSISQSGTAKKFDSATFIEPSQTAYISQIVDSETNKYKAIKISEKSADYSDRPDQYCIAVIDSDFNIKIYLSDTYVESSGISSLTPTFEIGVENSSFTASSVVWVKAFDGRNVSVQVRKTGDFIYLHITRQANSSAEPPIIGYIIDAYTYETIGQSGPTE